MTLAPLVLLPLALAQDVSVPPEPIPVEGVPVSVVVVAYLIPPQDPAWLTDAAQFRTCRVQVTFAPDAPVEATPLSCPEPMGTAVTQATRDWEYRLADKASTDATRFTVEWVFRYEEKLGLTTLHAEVDPGEDMAFTGVVGPPGVKLVHPAAVRKEVRARVPRKARKAGIEATPCAGRAELDQAGGPVRVEWTSCPDELRSAAGKALSKWSFTPRVVDGFTERDLVPVTVTFK